MRVLMRSIIKIIQTKCQISKQSYILLNYGMALGHVSSTRAYTDHLKHVAPVVPRLDV